MDRNMDKDFKDVPLSASNVSLKLALIQQRCSELMSDDSLSSLSFEELSIEDDNSDPYDRG